MGLRRGAVVMLGAQWGRYGVQLVSLVLLARLLSPGDFGLVTMATAVTGLAMVIGDFGLSLAALQAPTLSQPQKSALFWLNGLLGLVTAALVAAAAPLIAAIYGEPRLVPVVLALAGVFLVNGLSVQFSVEINRAGRFGALGLSELGSQASGLVLAACFAVAGFGYWALVLQQLGVAVVLLVWVAVVARWRPSLPRRTAGVRELLRFGRDTFGVQVANYVTSNLDSVLIGRLFGTLALGLYSRAFLLVMMPIQQIVAPLTRVFLPRLSALTDDDEFEALLVRLQRLIAYALLGPLSLLAAVATPLLVVLLGPRWADAGPLLQVLAIGAAFQSLGFVYYWAFLARRRTGELFKSEMWGRGVMTVLMVALVPFGSIWVAWTVVVGQALIWIAAVARYGVRAGVRPGPLLAVSARPAAILVVAGGAGAVAAASAAGAGPIAALGASLGVWMLCAGAGVLVLRRVREDLATVLSVVRRPHAVAVPV